MENNYSNLFNVNGDVSLKQSLPLAFEHLIAMIAGCIAPTLIFAGAAGLDNADSILLVQMSLIGSALTTLLILFGPARLIGNKLPMIYGVSFSYVPTMIALAGQFESLGAKNIVAIVLGAQLIAAVVSMIFGYALKYVLPYFPPLVAGTVVLSIGLSLYPVALNYMGGGGDLSMPGWGAWQYWFIAGVTLLANIIFTHFGKGMVSLASVLLSMIVGYILAYFMGYVNLTPVSEASWFSVVRPMYFGIKFEPSAIAAFIIIFIVSCIEGIGDMNSTTIGGMDRPATSDELRGGIIGFSLANIIGAFIGTLPTATFSQNAGIVSINKVINKKVFTTASIMILIAGLVPKFSSLLLTIPYPVIGGATLSVFAAITMNGIRMITSQPLSMRNTYIVGVSIAIGFGFTQVVSGAHNAGVTFMPESLEVAIGSSPVVLTTLFAFFMNILIPEKEEDK
ncbi:solute carrier family 23 protein [Anaerococcus nagyae]